MNKRMYHIMGPFALACTLMTGCDEQKIELPQNFTGKATLACEPKPDAPEKEPGLSYPDINLTLHITSGELTSWDLAQDSTAINPVIAYCKDSDARACTTKKLELGYQIFRAPVMSWTHKIDTAEGFLNKEWDTLLLSKKGESPSVDVFYHCAITNFTASTPKHP